MKAVVDAGLSGMTLPRKYDGLNFPLICFVMANEMVARADASFENIWGLQDCAETLNEFASEEIKQKYLPWVSAGATCAMDLTEPDAGSDLGADLAGDLQHAAVVVHRVVEILRRIVVEVLLRETALLQLHDLAHHGCWRWNCKSLLSEKKLAIISCF